MVMAWGDDHGHGGAQTSHDCNGGVDGDGATAAV